MLMVCETLWEVILHDFQTGLGGSLTKVPFGWVS